VKKLNKGIIMEIKKNYAIALNDEGLMEKIAYKNDMKIGQKIFYFNEDIINKTTKNGYKFNGFKKSFGSIAALFLIIFTFFQIMRPQEAFAVVSLDINPSIQIEADSKLNIIKVEGVNDDGKSMDFSDIKDIPLESGIQKIKDKLIANNYLEKNHEVLVGYMFENGNDETYVKNLEGAIYSSFDPKQVTFVSGDKEDVSKAKEQNISLGRYEAAARVTDEKIKDKIKTAPVKDITESIKDSENPNQWQFEDNKNDKAPAVTENPEVKSDKPASDKPKINAPSDTTESNIGSNKSNDNTGKTETKNNIIDLQPDVPATSGNSNSGAGGNSTTPSKDNGISLTPNSGSSDNTTNSGKSKEETKKIVIQEPTKQADNSIDIK
jgi:hypothetical protein